MIIARAEPSDVDTIVGWRHERTAWLAGRGLDQWSVPMPRTAIASTVAAGMTWMVRDGGDPVATITLTAWADDGLLWKAGGESPLWHPEDDPGDALYVSKMMVDLGWADRGVGAEMLRWAAGRAFDAGLTWTRLDAWSTNPSLHAYYRGQGYEWVRTVPGRVSGACFQKASQPYVGWLKTEGT